MKTLHLVACSPQDKPNGTIEPKKLGLASRQGKIHEIVRMSNHVTDTYSTSSGPGKPRFAKIFIQGPATPNFMTALAFCQGLGYVPPAIMPPVAIGLDDGDGLEEVVAARIQGAIEFVGQPELFDDIPEAVEKRLPAATYYAERLRQAMVRMFDMMGAGETGIAFFDTNAVAFAALAYHWEQPNDQRIGFLDGIILACGPDNSPPRVVGPISVNSVPK